MTQGTRNDLRVTQGTRKDLRVTQGTRKDLVEGVLDGHDRELRGEALVHIHQLLY